MKGGRLKDNKNIYIDRDTCVLLPIGRNDKMNLLKIEIKEKEILNIEVQDNYRPYAFVGLLYSILVISTYYTTWMYPATTNHEIEDLTTILIIVYTTIYIARK